MNGGHGERGRAEEIVMQFLKAGGQGLPRMWGQRVTPGSWPSSYKDGAALGQTGCGSRFGRKVGHKVATFRERPP